MSLSPSSVFLPSGALSPSGVSTLNKPNIIQNQLKIILNQIAFKTSQKSGNSNHNYSGNKEITMFKKFIKTNHTIYSSTTTSISPEPMLAFAPNEIREITYLLLSTIKIFNKSYSSLVKYISHIHSDGSCS